MNIGKEFETENVSRGNHDPLGSPGTHDRANIFVGVLILGMLCCADGFPFLYLYPLGIFYVFCSFNNPTHDVVYLGLGYFVCGGLLFLISRSKKRWFLVICVCLMVALTVTNVVGCRSMLHKYGNWTGN